MGRCKRLLAVACVAGAVPVSACAQYYVNLALIPTGPATCGSSGVSVPVTGTVDISLPDAENNVWELRVVYGHASSVKLRSIDGPFPQSSPSVGNLSLTTPDPVAPPYTLEVVDYPASNGVPVGLGTRVIAECSVNGTAVVTFVSGIPAPLPMAVPTLEPVVLALLAGLLAWSGAGRRQRLPS